MNSKGKLLSSAIAKYVIGLALVAVLLFVPAGTIDYSNGWLFMGVLFIPMLMLGVVLWVKSPELLRRRLDSKENRQTQQGIIKYLGLFFVIGFIVAGLDYRWGWSSVPSWISLGSAILFLIGYGLYGEVMRENMWLSRTIQVEKEQKVITTGLYGIVRHPMYSATLLMFLPMPLILGSWWAMPIFCLYVPLIVRRILDEEKLLFKELNGYKEHCAKLRWRLIPYIW